MAPISPLTMATFNTDLDAFQFSPETVDRMQQAFNLPANISFVASAAFTPPAQGAGATGASSGMQKGTAEQCAQCVGLPSAQRAQCLAALQC